MAQLTEDEIVALLAQNPGWRVEGGALVRNLVFDGFAEAIAFVNQVAALAEQQDHHPDIAIKFKNVRLELMSHDAGALTGRDAALVRRLNGLI